MTKHYIYSLIKYLKTLIPSGSAVYSVLIVLFLLSSGISLFAQVEEDTGNFQKEFDEFSKSIQTEFNSFKSENDSIFLQFLEESWTSFNLFYNERPARPKPEQQPVFKENDKKPEKIEPVKSMKPIDSANIKIEKTPPEIKNRLEIFKEKAETISVIEFYGTEIEVFYNEADLPRLKSPNKEYILDFFKQASSSSSLLNTIYLLKTSADEKRLNDWGFVQMLHNVSSGLYEKYNDQCLFAWYALLKTGIDARVGYDDKNIYLFMPCTELIYNVNFFSSNDKIFYLVPLGNLPGNADEVYSYEAEYPGSVRDISLKLKELPDIGDQASQQQYNFMDQVFTIELNRSLVDFYNDYPDCDLDIIFATPLSAMAVKSMDKFFEPYFIDMTETEIVEQLLKFVQHGVGYQIDDEQFGYENYLFAEETLFYANADCEDRSILLAQLINRYTGLKTIGLDYSQNIQHISLAVNLNETIEGDYILLDNQKYYICDPTFIGAKVGMIMESAKNEVPVIIIY